MGSTHSEDNWSWIHGESAISCYRALGTCRKSASLGTFLTWSVCVRGVCGVHCQRSWTPVTKPYQQKLGNGSPSDVKTALFRHVRDCFCVVKAPRAHFPSWGGSLAKFPLLEFYLYLCLWIKMCIHGNGPPSSALSAACSESQRVCPPWSWWLHPGDCPALRGCCVSVPTSNHKELKSTLFSKNSMVFEYKVCARLPLCSNWVYVTSISEMLTHVWGNCEESSG